MMQFKREVATVQTELKATQLRLKHVGAELSEKRKASKSMTKTRVALGAIPEPACGLAPGAGAARAGAAAGGADPPTTSKGSLHLVQLMRCPWNWGHCSGDDHHPEGDVSTVDRRELS